MPGKPNDDVTRVVELVDAANRALDRNDRQGAIVNYARASELLFQQAGKSTNAAQKISLANRAKSLLATVQALKGAAGEADAGGPDEKTGGASRQVTSGMAFDDVAGLEDVKETLRLRVVYPLKHPEKMERYGLQAGGGMLLFGPPGTGKTMIARALAGELSLPFFAVKPSEMLSKYVGESEKIMAELFQQVRGHAQGAVVFIDEIDAIGADRSEASEHSRRLLTQLLQELDGVHGRPKGLLFLAATNEPWLLDQALLRPPRFSEKCYVPLPDQPARRLLIQLQLRSCPLAGDVNWDELAERTGGYSGADLVGVCERAKQIPFREAVLNGLDRPLSEADLRTALDHVKPSVSPDSVRRYEEFAAG